MSKMESHTMPILYSAGSIMAGMNATNFMGSTMANLLIGCGIFGVSYSLYDYCSKGDYKELFENIGLKNKEGKYPLLKKKEKYDQGTRLVFNLPTGLCLDDFEKVKQRIQQHFDSKNIMIHYANKNIIVKLIDKELEEEYPFELVEHKMTIPILAGRSFSNMEMFDLAEGEPHMGIYGESGGGKSTVLRAIITLIICTTKLALHLIDLKGGAEFGIFEKCKHVKTFSKNIKDAEKVLYQLSSEVDRRYNLFYENNVVDIAEYNKKFPKNKLTREIVVIDEFADLKTEKDSIGIIEMLSSKARACGIHLVISTQRPSAKVVNGDIKANIPRVIGLKCLNGTNSRIILDHNGLEDLRGRGHAIIRNKGKETEIQALNITPQQARDLVKPYYIDKKKEVKKEKKQIGKVEDFSFRDKK